MLVEIIKTSLIYTFAFVLLLFAFGAIFSYIEKTNSSSIYRTFGMNGLLITGIIGTIVHEFSHMIFCVIFRHEITDFSLFRPFKSRYDGIMGYVNHRCDLNSYYQRVGNFFIGIAPIIFGTIFLMLCMWILLPSEFNSIRETFNENMDYIKNIHHIKDSVNIYITIVISTLENLSPFRNHNIIKYLVFIYIMYSVTTHMDLSKEDLSNSKSGFFVFISLLFIINFLCVFMGLKYKIILLRFIISVFSFLTVGLLFATVTMLISKALEIFFA